MHAERELPPRIDAVLAVIHLVFATGHTAPTGADLMRRDLVERALDLARMLRALLPDEAGVAGLLALIVLSDARQRTRTSDDGTLLLLQSKTVRSGTMRRLKKDCCWSERRWNADRGIDSC